MTNSLYPYIKTKATCINIYFTTITKDKIGYSKQIQELGDDAMLMLVSEILNYHYQLIMTYTRSRIIDNIQNEIYGS